MKDSSKKSSSTFPMHQYSNEVIDTQGNVEQGLQQRHARGEEKTVDRYQIGKAEGSNHLTKDSAIAEHRQQWQQVIQSGCRAIHNAFLSRFSFNEQTLPHLDSQYSSFNLCKFKEATLTQSQWQHCELKGAHFNHADLKQSKFENCNLNGADFRGANLSNAHFVNCDLTATNFDHAILQYAVIENCIMYGQSFYKTQGYYLELLNLTLEHGFLDSADFQHLVAEDVLFEHCTLSDTNFSDSQLTHCIFENCDSVETGPNFSGTQARAVSIIHCRLHAADFSHALFDYGIWYEFELQHAILDNTCFDQIAFNEGDISHSFCLEQAPHFSGCQLSRMHFNSLDLNAAIFESSTFDQNKITDCDVQQWQLSGTTIDKNTTIS